MNGLASYFTMDQTLIFNECQHNSFNHSFNSMTHVVTRNTVMNDRKNNVLRFSSTNQIGAVDGKLN